MLTTSERAAVAALVAATLITSPVLGVLFTHLDGVVWAAFVVTTFGGAWLHARWTLRAQTTSGVAAKSIVAGVLCGVQSVLATALVWWFRVGADCCVEPLLGMSWFAFYWGSIPGLLRGLAFVPLALAMQPRRKRFSVQASDQAVLEAAGWLLLVAGFAAGWAQVAFDGYLPGDAYLASLLLPTALGALAIAVIVCVGARLALRRRWLERVRSGSVPGWSVSPVDEWPADEVTHLQPLLPGPFQGEVLARTVSDGEGYRVARRRKAVALVPVSY